MRGSVIIAFVVVGGAVVVTPVIAEYLLRSSHQANVVRLLERPGLTSVNLQREEIGTGLQVGCWFTGTALALVGSYLAVRAGREDARRPVNSGHGPSEPEFGLGKQET